MKINNFIRFAEAVKVKVEKRILSITVRPTITDCSGSIYLTDLQIQEGDKLTGYAAHTSTMLHYPPNKTPKAVEIAMEQTKLMCENEAN